MADRSTVNLQAALAVLEQIDSAASPATGSSGEAKNYRAYDVTERLDDSSTPAVGAPVIDLSHTLAGATFDHDLTAAPQARDVNTTADLTGKRLVSFIIKACEANAGDVTISAPTNGYPLFGGASDQVTLKPGHVLVQSQYALAANMAAVGPTERLIRIAGAIGDGVDFLAVPST